MPKPKKINVEKVAPFVRGTCNEIEDFAVQQLAVNKAREIDRATFDLVEGLGASNRAVRVEGDPLVRRAALLRVAAAAIALLALDEVSRGSRAVTRDMKKIDPLGFVR